MAKKVVNLLDRPIETMWDGVVYIIPAKGFMIYENEVIARKFNADLNQNEYPADGSAPRPRKCVEIVDVDAVYTENGVLVQQAKVSYTHPDGSEFDSIAELLDYTTALAKQEALAQYEKQAAKPVPPVQPVTPLTASQEHASRGRGAGRR